MPNPFVLGEDPDDETGGDGDPGSQNPNFADLRKYARKTERELKAAQAELETLRAFQAETQEAQRVSTVDSIFKEVGVENEYARGLFLKEVGEEAPTADAAREFFAKLGVQTTAGETVETPTPDPTKQGIKPVTAGTVPAATRMSMDEWSKLHATDVAAAQEAWKSGLVDKDTPDWNTGQVINVDLASALSSDE